MLAQLTACRTAALGGHVWRCAQCGGERVSYNSCRNRFCPGCGGTRRAEWLEQLAASLLPVAHFQVVFTVPHELSRLMLANRRELYGLLFASAAATLQDVAADPQHLGGQIGALLVLHTWGQRLEHHPHIHAVVPAGGLSWDGKRWLPSRAPKFLLPVRVLSAVFRGKFLEGLRALFAAGRLQVAGELAPLAEPAGFAEFLSGLYQHAWNVFCEAPPAAADAAAEKTGTPSAAPLLKYLARYVAGAAISAGRLISYTGREVTFWAKDYRRKRRVQVRLSGVEFTRRFALHILPAGFARVRRIGILANHSRAAARCRELLGTPPVSPPPAAESPARLEPAAAAAPVERPVCPACREGRLGVVSVQPRPRLCEVLDRSGFTRERVASARSREDSS